MALVPEPQRRRIIEYVDNWKFWATIFGFGLVGVIVALFVLYGRTAREEADRVARARTDAAQAVATCFNAVQNAPVVDGFIESHEALINNGILTNERLLELDNEPPAVVKVRQQSLARLRRAQSNVKELKALIAVQTPTKKACIRLAKEKGVPYAIYLAKLGPKDKKPKRAPTTTGAS